MKSSNILHKKVAANKVAAIATATDPLNSSRLPIGIELTAMPDLYEIPASGTLTNPWQAVALVDKKTEEVYFISPRVFLGLGYFGGKFSELIARNFPKGSLLTYLATAPVVVVTEYKAVSQDVYGSNPLTQDDKEMPVLTVIKEVVAPKPLTKAEKDAIKAAKEAAKV